MAEATLDDFLQVFTVFLMAPMVMLVAFAAIFFIIYIMERRKCSKQ